MAWVPGLSSPKEQMGNLLLSSTYCGSPSPRCSWPPLERTLWFPGPLECPVPTSDTRLGGFLWKARLVQLCSLFLHLHFSLLGCFIPHRACPGLYSPLSHLD